MPFITFTLCHILLLLSTVFQASWLQHCSIQPGTTGCVRKSAHREILKAGPQWKHYIALQWDLAEAKLKRRAKYQGGLQQGGDSAAKGVIKQQVHSTAKGHIPVRRTVQCWGNVAVRKLIEHRDNSAISSDGRSCCSTQPASEDHAVQGGQFLLPQLGWGRAPEVAGGEPVAAVPLWSRVDHIPTSGLQERFPQTSQPDSAVVDRGGHRKTASSSKFQAQFASWCIWPHGQ